jgi:hypothetical protein
MLLSSWGYFFQCTAKIGLLQIYVVISLLLGTVDFCHQHSIRYCRFLCISILLLLISMHLCTLYYCRFLCHSILLLNICMHLHSITVYFYASAFYYSRFLWWWLVKDLSPFPCNIFIETVRSISRQNHSRGCLIVAKMLKKIPNGRKIFKIVIKYLYQHLPFWGPTKFTLIGIFCVKNWPMKTRCI